MYTRVRRNHISTTETGQTGSGDETDTACEGSTVSDPGNSVAVTLNTHGGRRYDDMAMVIFPSREENTENNSASTRRVVALPLQNVTA